MTIKALDLARKAREALLSKKGENVVVLDVSKISSVTDFYVIATGNNPPHIKALADEAARVLLQNGVRCYRRAGKPDSQWVTADYLDVVIHVFTSAVRDYYDLDHLWNDAVRVEE